jgi:hypothetical protein
MQVIKIQQALKVSEQLRAKSSSPVLINYVQGNLRSFELAHDLLRILKEAGWTVEVETPPTEFDLPHDDVFVGVDDCTHPPEGAQTLLQALGALDLRVRCQLENSTLAKADSIVLHVGTDPTLGAR